MTAHNETTEPIPAAVLLWNMVQERDAEIARLRFVLQQLASPTQFVMDGNAEAELAARQRHAMAAVS